MRPDQSKAAAEIIEARWGKKGHYMVAHKQEHAARLAHVAKLRPEQRERYKRYQKQRRSEGRIQVYLTEKEIASARHPNDIQSGAHKRT